MSNAMFIVNTAKHLVDDCVSLKGQPNSPLGVFIDATTRTCEPSVSYDPAWHASHGDAEAISTIARCLEHYDISPLEDAMVATTAKNIGEAICVHTDYFKNTIKPLIVEYVELVKNRLDDPFTIVTDYNLIATDLPGPMVDPSFKQEITSNDGGTYANPDYVVNIPVAGPSSIVDKMLTGTKSLDNYIAAWAGSLGDVQLTRMWEQLYTGKGEKLITLVEDNWFGPEYALMAYLSSRRMHDEIPDGVVMNLSTFKTVMTQIRDAAAIRLSHVYERDDAFIKSGLLILKTNAGSMDIKLHAGNYKRYINEGGKNEIIIGSLLDGGGIKTISELQNNADKYYKTYERNESIAGATRKLNAFNVLREALQSVFVDLLTNPSAREVEARSTFNLTVDGMIASAQKVIYKLDGSDLKDIFTACLKVMCRARFNYTDAEKFLTSMHEVGLLKPTIDPNEAAYLALCELVGDYLTNQIVVISEK